MVSRLELLEKERMKLKAFSAEVIENNIDGILGGMPLSIILTNGDSSEEENPAKEVITLLSLLVIIIILGDIGNIAAYKVS